jgi:hypothetical protein
MKSIDTVIYLAESVKASLERREEVKKKMGRNPQTGFDVNLEDSKESVQRRILLMREELLKLSKSL